MSIRAPTPTPNPNSNPNPDPNISPSPNPNPTPNPSRNPNRNPTPSRLKHWQQDSAGDGLCPLGCRVTESLLHILCQCLKDIKEEPQSRITWRHDSILLAIYKSVKDQIKEAMESRVETEVEDFIGFKSNLGKFTAPRAQSSQSPLLESADDWKVQFDVNDEGVSVKERPFPSEIVVPLCVEVGARGAINEQPWNWMCKRLGFSKCSKRWLTQGVQDAAGACSPDPNRCMMLLPARLSY